MRRLVYASFLGLGLGLTWALIRGLPFFFAVQFPQGLRAASETLNAPALWCVQLWSDGAGLPPRGEFGKAFVLASALIIVQWLAAGLLLGLWWRRGNSSKSG